MAPQRNRRCFIIYLFNVDILSLAVLFNPLNRHTISHTNTHAARELFFVALSRTTTYTYVQQPRTHTHTYGIRSLSHPPHPTADKINKMANRPICLSLCLCLAHARSLVRPFLQQRYTYCLTHTIIFVTFVVVLPSSNRLAGDWWYCRGASDDWLVALLLSTLRSFFIFIFIVVALLQFLITMFFLGCWRGLCPSWGW